MSERKRNVHWEEKGFYTFRDIILSSEMKRCNPLFWSWYFGFGLNNEPWYVYEQRGDRGDNQETRMRDRKTWSLLFEDFGRDTRRLYLQLFETVSRLFGALSAWMTDVIHEQFTWSIRKTLGIWFDKLRRCYSRELDSETRQLGKSDRRTRTISCREHLARLKNPTGLLITLDSGE